MNEDMSDMIKKISSMMKKNEFPDELKNIVSNLSSNNNISNASSNNSESNTFDNTSSNNIKKRNISSNSDNKLNDTSSEGSSLGDFDFDINTMIKMKSIIDAMNNPKDDPRANLLKSLKPYLKESRKEKVDQYIKIFSMGKVFETLNLFGGDKKNDV